MRRVLGEADFICSLRSDNIAEFNTWAAFPVSPRRRYHSATAEQVAVESGPHFDAGLADADGQAGSGTRLGQKLDREPRRDFGPANGRLGKTAAPVAETRQADAFALAPRALAQAATRERLHPFPPFNPQIHS